jgi:hypothetical protein
MMKIWLPSKIWIKNQIAMTPISIMNFNLDLENQHLDKIKWLKYLVITRINKIFNIMHNSKLKFKVHKLLSIVLKWSFCKKEIKTKIFRKILISMKTMKIKLKDRISQFKIFEIKLKVVHLKQLKIILVLEEMLVNKVKWFKKINKIGEKLHLKK